MEVYDDIDLKETRKKHQAFIDKLGINVSPGINMRKPEMYIKKII